MAFLGLFCILHSFTAQANARAFLQTNSGYLDPQELHIDGRVHKITNHFMSTYDIDEFDYLKEKDPEAWKSLHNHYRYGVVGTRGILAGAGAAAAAVLISGGRAHLSIPIGLFLVGLVYGLNSKHMAQHNLHEAINKLNGVKTAGSLEPRLEILVSMNETSSLAVRLLF